MGRDLENRTFEVLVCQHQSCLARGSAEVLAHFLATPIAGVTVVGSECQGQCNMAATVRVLPDEVWYCRVKPDHVATIIEQHLRQGESRVGPAASSISLIADCGQIKLMEVGNSLDLGVPTSVGVEIEEPKPRFLSVNREIMAFWLKLNAG